jgi:predicted metal-dependent phosphoesterase TrpH
MMVELHCHSLFSVDGWQTPEAVAERAAAGGVDVLALTDHNTVDGVARAARRAAALGLRCIPGVEFDAMWRSQEHHVIGLGFDPDHAAVRDLCRRQFAQYERNFARFLPILQRRYGVTEEELRAGLAARYPTHPAPVLNKWFARSFMLEQRHFADERAALAGMSDVATEAEGHLEFPWEWVAIEEVRDAVHAAGGVALLAHVALLRRGDAAWQIQRIEELLAIGLDGFELYHPANRSEPHFSDLCAAAQRLGCVVSGGTDSHGDDLFRAAPAAAGMAVPEWVMASMGDVLGRPPAQPRRVRCTPVERILAFVHDELEGDGMVTAVARCEGVLQADRLRVALDDLQARHTKLGAGIVPGPGNWPHFEFSPVPPKIPCEYRLAVDDQEWERAVLQDRPGAFARDAVPLIRFLVLVHPSRKVTDLVCWCHHSVCDALSLWTVFVELLRFYGDAAWNPGQAPEGMGLLIPGTPKGTRLERWRLLIRIILAAVRERRQHQVHFPADEALPPGRMDRRFFSQDDTAVLIERCRRENATVFTALAAASFFAIAEEYQWGGCEIAFNAPVSVREHLRPVPPTPETLGAFVTTVRTLARLPGTDEPFWAAAIRFRETWNESLRTNDPIQALRMLGLLPMRRDFVAKRTSVVSVNSLGRMNQPILGGEPRILDFTWFGRAAIGGAPFTIYAATVAGRFSFSIRAERQDPERVARLCDRMHARLRAAIGAHEPG